MDRSILDEARFEPVDRDGWRQLAEGALKGAPFETLVSTTLDGISYGPIEARWPHARPIARRRTGPWTIVQRVDDPDLERAARQVGDDLSGGADALALTRAGAPTASAFGLAALDRDRLEALLGDRRPALFLDGGSDAEADALAALAGERALAVHLGRDPFAAALLRDGTAPPPDAAFAERVMALHATAGGTVLAADGRIAHNAGASEAQELAVVLAALAGLLRVFEAAGIGPQDLLSMTALRLAADQEQFLTIAKLRAARLLHRRLAEACGVADPGTAFIHAETSLRMLAARDIETNILRNTVAAFGAGVGGADAVTIVPHTFSRGLPDAPARRLARNTQVLLIHECHLDHVTDPAAGAGGIEALTEALAERAWGLFQEIEAEGGLGKSLASGALAARIGKARAARAGEVKAGRRAILGTTLYPPADERPVGVLAEAGDHGPSAALAPAPLHLDIEENAP